MSKLEDEIGHVDINDRTIQRIVNEMEKKGFLKDELKKKQINQTQYDISMKIYNSKQWPSIAKLWTSFEKEMRLQMTTPIKMSVYDYTTYGSKIVEMSPLDSIKYHRKHMQIGSMAVDPHTGEIKA